MGWKKVVIGGALISAGFYKMFDMLLMDKAVYESLDESDAAFVAYLTLFNKPYETLQEYQYRKSYFKKTLKVIKDQELHGSSYILSLNHMADWSEEEYFQILGVVPDDVTFPDQVINNDGQNADQ